MKCIGEEFVIRDWQGSEYYVNLFLVFTIINVDTLFLAFIIKMLF